MRNVLKGLRDGEKGATVVDYGLIAALVVAALITAAVTMGPDLAAAL